MESASLKVWQIEKRTMVKEIVVYFQELPVQDSQYFPLPNRILQEFFPVHLLFRTMLLVAVRKLQGAQNKSLAKNFYQGVVIP